jgi:SpoVK/Ycf46/Vps4 family AAA+-type ATPase
MLEVPPLIRLWVLRLLVDLNGQREFIDRDSFSSDKLADFLGLGKWIDPDDGEFSGKLIKAELRKLRRAAEQDASYHEIPSCLKKNVQRLAKLSGMTEVDCRILEFAVLLKSERLLEDATDILGRLSSSKACFALSTLLNLSPSAVSTALSEKGVLCRTGLVSIERSGKYELSEKLNLISDRFADRVCSSDTDPINLLRDMVVLSGPPELSLDDYGHVAKSLAVLQLYLKHSIATRRKGVNIFLHGMPGTGKTQLSKVLAKELCCDLFEITSEDDDGDAISGESRLRAYRATQGFFGGRKVLVMFDEAEDVFNDGNFDFGRKSTAQLHKSWINRMLEENILPTLWCSNSVRCLDPAFVRRFDMVIELPIPPRQQREKILQANCADLLDTAAISRMAESEHLAPAIAARAARVIRPIHLELGKEGAQSAMELMVNCTLEAQGHKTIQREGDPNRLPDIYDPMFINADANLKEVAKGLAQTGAGRLCLYGPPGTGKTAYGRWLAGQLQRPLSVRRASDLISMWVGGTEKNIADAFKRAEQDHAVLLIDEVDSFLQDRRGASQSWEVTAVNEMLTQMESFPGVFVASTNLMNGLDQAALRRFDLKVKFNFLTDDQAYELVCRHCAMLNIPPPDAATRARLDQMNALSLGDFAAVIRQHRFRPITSAHAMVIALAAECSLKEEDKGHIGFI